MGLPYPLTNQRGFERANGKFEHDGEFYTVVKSRYKNDTLYVVCLKNHIEKRLVKTMTDFGNLSNDVSTDEPQTILLLGKLLKDFHQDQMPGLPAKALTHLQPAFNNVSPLLLSRSDEVHSPPPRI